ncbi:hypothetical protein GM418_08990 [Maribellus comscasis]|uniref:Uncharacterized protein n=1 Tax=Maribellus comscasis TaxID=2681766 RepID=A0A6I6JRF0_9BACT|nr:hypothetical protein [Maribellus comscasis]QGY43789.1 hypothetical protein GM418_08990 [Maribellus comscasis]
MGADFAIKFETKEESNQRRQDEALRRTPHERLMFFLEMMQEMQFFASSQEHPNRAKNNFIIE